MDFRNFLILKLKQFARSFPYLSIDLENNSVSSMYFIKISPIEQFRGNKDIISAVKVFYLEQMESFPDESLTFISDDSYYKISNPFLRISPNEYYNINYKNFNRNIFDPIILSKSYTVDFGRQIFVTWDNQNINPLTGIRLYKPLYKRQLFFNCFYLKPEDLPIQTNGWILKRSVEPTEKLVYAS
jgi:hypothetical protein